jgi:protein-S-isoprenylcysteine O-methyltransferase Ste14
MNSQRILGIALLVAGVILLVFGLQATDSVTESVKEGVTGTYTDKTTWFIVGGAAAAIIGGLITLFGGRRTLSH